MEQEAFMETLGGRHDQEGNVLPQICNWFHEQEFSWLQA